MTTVCSLVLFLSAPLVLLTLIPRLCLQLDRHERPDTLEHRRCLARLLLVLLRHLLVIDGHPLTYTPLLPLSVTAILPGGTLCAEERRRCFPQLTPALVVVVLSLQPSLNSVSGLRRSNSTGTLFVDSTISQPNREDTLACVALALHYIIVDGHAQDEPLLLSQKFDERR